MPDGLLPVLVVLAVAVVRLIATTWSGSAWSGEDTVALAFALMAGYLATQYLPLGGRSGD